MYHNLIITIIHFIIYPVRIPQ